MFLSPKTLCSNLVTPQVLALSLHCYQTCRGKLCNLASGLTLVTDHAATVLWLCLPLSIFYPVILGVTSFVSFHDSASLIFLVLFECTFSTGFSDFESSCRPQIFVLPKVLLLISFILPLHPPSVIS